MTPRRFAGLPMSAFFIAMVACGEVRQQADTQFGDQHFKSAIAFIELHKVRFGSYLDRLGDLRFTGQWDRLWMSAVRYTKLDDGYDLDVVRGWVGTPELAYPPEFWQGLGLRNSNVRRRGASKWRGWRARVAAHRSVQQLGTKGLGSGSGATKSGVVTFLTARTQMTLSSRVV
jgi:hypothetical protein